MGCGQSSASADAKPSKRLLEEYSVGATLGEGAFGVVYACTHRSTGEEVAVKMVDKVETPVEAIRREADMLKALSHPTIVKFHQVFFDRYFVCIVMDKYSGGDLVEGLHLHLKEKGKIDCHSIVHVCEQMGSAIQHLHNNSIVHRDVKGDNYLMDRKNITDLKCRIALSDFGTAVTLKPGERLNSEVGTRVFWPPEFFNQNYSFKVDVWAMGIIVYGLLDSRFPFKDESDIRKKEPRFPKRIAPECEAFMKAMLTKDEDKRATADEIMAHPWISKCGMGNASTDGERRDDDDPAANDEATLRVDGANDGIQERRRELMERLNNEQKGKTDKASVKKTEAQQHYWAKWFTIVDKHSPGSTLKFEWWGDQKVASSGILKLDGVPRNADRVNGKTNRSPELVRRTLRDHNIDDTKFGSGEAKTLEQMATEVQSGAARLMLDATEHKKLVRVVDVVLLRLYSSKGGKLLIEIGEQFPDGRRRNIARLPGTKKEPHENSRETANRITKDLLKMGDCNVEFDFDQKEVFEEEMESPSYPGVGTVYRKEIVPGYVNSTSSSALGRIGLPNHSDWQAEDNKKNIKFFGWMLEKDAAKKQVKMKAEGSEEVSGLVMAPIGMKENQLAEFLGAHNVDIDQYGKNQSKTLKEFSTELIKGESSLIEEASGEVIRVVDLVIIKIVNSFAGDLLVQSEQTSPDGAKTVLNRLPGAKKRPDESQFLTARRILRKQLKIDENQVRLDAANCEYFEEERAAPGFPGVRTVYRKRLITAELTKT